MEQPIVIDIRTRFISENNRVYLIFPGDGYKFYDDFEKDKVVYLDIPGFPWPSGGMNKARDIVERLVVSERVRDWQRKGKPSNSIPARDPTEIGEYRATKARQQKAAWIRHFFTQLKRGDVVIVPPQQFDSDILYGEVVDDPDVPIFVRFARYPDEVVPARRVAWMARQPRHAAAGWLERRLPNQNPVRQLESSYHKYIYDYMYKRYFYNNQFVCKYSIETDHYSSLDDFLISQIFLYVTALFESRHGSSPVDAASLSISEIVSAMEFSNQIPFQRVSIQSRGAIVLYGLNIVPLVAGVMMTISATCASDALERPISVVNSADSSDASKACEADIADEVKAEIAAMGQARWHEVCLAEAKARERTKLDPGMGGVLGSSREQKQGESK